MVIELRLDFPDADHVQVFLQRNEAIEDSSSQPYAPPLSENIRRELTWYLETYPAQYTTELDDERAESIASKLKDWGRTLFNSAFASTPARRLFDRFQDSDAADRLLTISSLHPSVLAQPWELLCDPDGTFLFLSNPHISIRRRLHGVGKSPHRSAPKDKLHLLFVVSRPDDVGLIDPRADPMAVMDALDAEAPGSVSVEFLRPPTLGALIRRMNDNKKPPVDILHFDGHGAYDPDGRFSERARQAIAAAGADELMRDTPAAGEQGYLLFEDDDHKSALVSADRLGDLLESKRVGLVLLSACQSAVMSGEDALSSVAPRLIRAGIPSVLAMTQSVLVETTRALSRHFYRELAAGRSIGAALDESRVQLYADTKRGERRRAAGTIALNLQDWFLPALYQAGADGALLTAVVGRSPPTPAPLHNLRDTQESGFHGRRVELRNIERWFVDGTRRIVITGFGGQGKTVLAQEAGRWLLRTGLFERVCFVTYAGFQGSDAVQMLVSELGIVLNTSLINIEAAHAVLRNTPTLLILDNLESLDTTTQSELLTAAANCSVQGNSRVLVTTRPDSLVHQDYPTSGSRLCRYLALDGLTSADALDWFQELLRLPPDPQVPIPNREAIEQLFAQVRFHPLSIGVLTQLVKQQRIADVAEGLRARLTLDTDPLVASLNLSLARLDKDAQTVLPGLGVFVDGALESVLTKVLELNEPHWAQLRDALRQAGLVVMETIPGIDTAFIRFHPTLAPAMRERLAPGDLARLSERYRAAYFELSSTLYFSIGERVALSHAIARRELPNLLAAVMASIEHGEASAADFADNVAHFLTAFGQTRDLAMLLARAERAAGESGSDAWFLTRKNLGEQLFANGQYFAAEAVFDDILDRLGDVPSSGHATMLGYVARCQSKRGNVDSAETNLRKALSELAALQSNREIRSEEGVCHTDLGDVLRSRGDLGKAQAEYETSIAIGQELSDERMMAVGYSQLGTVFLLRTNFSQAAESYRAAIAVFESLQEPTSLATCYNQLGVIYSRAGDLAGAERAYRESARIKESLGKYLAAAGTWVNLAITLELQGLAVEKVEPWYRKALTVAEDYNEHVLQATILNNLADLLKKDSSRLTEARETAERALAIKRTLDSAAAQIWTTFSILANIADKQRDSVAASNYRAEARRAYAAAPIARETLRRYRPIIGTMLAVLVQPTDQPEVESTLVQLSRNGWANLVAALRAILDGQRDEDTLSDPLDREDSLVVHTILRCLDDPEAAKEFLSPDE